MSGTGARGTITGDDVRVAVRWLADRLVDQPVSAFDAQAGPVRWSCWTTTEHVVDDLLAYALQLAALPALAYVPLVGPRGCLVYTSPTPRGRTRAPMAASA